MRVLVRISPIILLPDRFTVKPYPSKQKKGGWKFALKGLSAWACLLGKNGAFLETLETSFLAITWVSGTLQYAPKACPVKYYGLECWGWAVVGSDSWDFQKPSIQLALATSHTRSIGSLGIIRTSKIFNDNSPSGLTVQLLEQSLLILIVIIVSMNQLQKSVLGFMQGEKGWSFLKFPCQKGVQNRTLTPDPRTFTKMSPILLQTPLVSWWYPGGALLNRPSGRESSPAHLLPKTECAGVLKRV